VADADPTSLDRLHDIVVPAPVPWWPPAPGWFPLGGMVLALLGLAAWAAIARRRRNRYRRAALAELGQLPPTVEGLAPLAELVKRTALAAFPRERVASLTGRPWLEFLDSTGGKALFADGPGRFLEAGTYSRGPGTLSDAEIVGLFEAARHWIRRHRC
jgi:hypothetical protein